MQLQELIAISIGTQLETVKRHQYQTSQYWHQDLWLDYLPVISMYTLPEMGVFAIISQSTTLAPAKVVYLEWDLCSKFSLSIPPSIESINYLEKPTVKLLNCWWRETEGSSKYKASRRSRGIRITYVTRPIHWKLNLLQSKRKLLLSYWEKCRSKTTALQNWSTRE